MKTKIKLHTNCVLVFNSWQWFCLFIKCISSHILFILVDGDQGGSGGRLGSGGKREP